MRKSTNERYGTREDDGANHAEQGQRAQTENESIRVPCKTEIQQTDGERRRCDNKVRPDHCGGRGQPRSSEPMSVDSEAHRAGKSDAGAVHRDTCERFTDLQEPWSRDQEQWDWREEEGQS
jgi:hypothetical protein